MDSNLFLEIGVILLTVSLTILLALWTAQFLDSTPVAVVTGTVFFCILYFGAAALNLDLLIVSPVAIGLCAVAIVVASITANIEVSKAEI